MTAAPAEQVTGIEGYQALILGSAVYAGIWLDAAKQLADRIADPPGSIGSSPAGSTSPGSRSARRPS